MNLCVRHVRKAQLTQIGGHVKSAVEVLQRLNTSQRRIFRVIIIHRAAHHTHGKLRKAADIVLTDIARPASPNCGKSRTVNQIKHAADLVLHLVAGKITQASRTGQAVVGQAARPHQLRTCVIIGRVLHYDGRIVQHRHH